MNQQLKVAATLATLLDARFRIGKFSFGIDPLLGLIPGGGDLISLGLSLYIVFIGIQMGLPYEKLAQMLFYVIVDTVIGAIPFLGDIFDFGFKANLRNLEILKEFTA